MRAKFSMTIYIFLLLICTGCTASRDTETKKNQQVLIESTPNYTETVEEHPVFTLISNDELTVINVTTSLNNDKYVIDKISTVVNGEIVNNITTVVGYYNDMHWEYQQSLVAIRYSGKKWTNFLLLDVKLGELVFFEPFNFEDIRVAFNNVNKINYDVNENGVVEFFLNKVIDESNLEIGYKVHDTAGNLQSGIFTYSIPNKRFDSLKQNDALSEG